MFAALLSFGLADCLHDAFPPPPGGFLRLNPRRAALAVGPRRVPYRPREGDLVFYDDRKPVWGALFALAGTGSPTHMGIVVRNPDGSFGVLEAGPDDGLWVALLDLGPRLRQFRRDYPRGVITVRRCKRALSREHSEALTRFAVAQKGKRYAAGRLLLQGTPFRPRGPLSPWRARTYLDRDAWICSELAVAAGTVAGLFDPRLVRANAAYPRDLVDNCHFDLGGNWHDAAVWEPAAGRTPRGLRSKPGNEIQAGGRRLVSPPRRIR